MGIFAKKERIGLKIEGMTCGGCVRHVTEALKGVDGVRTVAVDLEAGAAAVEVSGTPDVAALTAAVREAGYEARAA